jgi:hypothetical protein
VSKAIRWICLATLLMMTLVAWRAGSDAQFVLEFIIFLRALVVSHHAYQKEQYFWTAGFVAISGLFNPFEHFQMPSGSLYLLTLLMCFATFAFSLIGLKTETLHMPSMMNGKPQSRSTYA